MRHFIRSRDPFPFSSLKVYFRFVFFGRFIIFLFCVLILAFLADSIDPIHQDFQVFYVIHFIFIVSDALFREVGWLR